MGSSPFSARACISYTRAVHKHAAARIASMASGHQEGAEDGDAGLVISDSDHEESELLETWGDNMLWARSRG